MRRGQRVCLSEWFVEALGALLLRRKGRSLENLDRTDNIVPEQGGGGVIGALSRELE